MLKLTRLGLVSPGGVQISMVLGAAILCVASSARSPDGDRTEQEVALYENTDDFFLEALATGVLAYENHCVYVVSGSERFVPIFPKGSVRWDGTTLTFGNKKYVQGDVIKFGGGIASPPQSFQIPVSCDPQAATWLVGEPVE